MITGEIHNAIEGWYEAIEKGMDESMPKTTREIILRPITSPLLNYIQHEYRQIQRISQIRGWIIQNYYRYRMLRTMLKNESQRIKNDNWNKLMEATATKYKEPKEFWRAIKNQEGTKIQANNYLQVNNNKLISDKDKEEVHRTIQKEIFKIFPQENIEYDRDQEVKVESYLEGNQIRVTTYRCSDLNRLQGENYIDTLISVQEIKQVIKNFKNNTPGETSINKTVLKNIPIRALSTLQMLFNHSLSLGYIPKKFKTPLIKMIPKANADIRDPKKLPANFVTGSSWKNIRENYKQKITRIFGNQ